MSRIDNFKGKNGTNTFKDRKGDINRKGRPKKTLNLVIEELKNEGYEIPSKKEVEESYLMFIGLMEEDIKKKIADKEQPMIFRIIGKNLLSGKGFDIMEKMIDRSLGKPKQEIDNNIVIDNSNPLLERLQELNKKTTKKTNIRKTKK